MKINPVIKSVLYLSCCLLLLFSCEESRVFDKNISVANAGWDYDDAKSFDIHITDTASTYNLFINIRHTDTYPYNNIWMKIITIYPDSTRQEGRVNIQVSESDGKWTGNCADGVCFNSLLVQQNFKFEAAGNYTFILQQDMRINPLPSIMNVGLKVEKFITP